MQMLEKIKAGAFLAPLAFTFLVFLTAFRLTSLWSTHGLGEFPKSFLALFLLFVLLFTHRSTPAPTNLII